MKLIDLHIQNFGKFYQHDIVFQDGINIIYGKNEAGKSTVHSFIRGMFYGIERGRGRASKNSLYTKFHPWEQKESFAGTMRVEFKGEVYRIDRNFHASSKELTVVNETRGIAVTPAKSFLDQLLGNLSETAYLNTVSIGQLKSATDDNMVTELKNYIANLNNSGSMALNISKATDYLKGKRREFEKQMIPEAAKEYAALAGSIRSLDLELQDPRYENQLPLYLQMQNEVRLQMEERQERKEALIQKAASGRQILENNHFTDQASILEYQKQTQEAFQNYLTEKKACQRKLPFLLAICFLALGLGLSGLGAYGLWAGFPLLALSVQMGISIQPVFLLILGGLLTMFSIMVMLNRKRHKKDFRILKKLLEEVFARHLTDTAISDQAIEAFHSRMKDFLRLHTAIIQSDLEVDQINMDLTRLKGDQTNCNQEMEIQRRNQWDLEQKLEKLNSLKDRSSALRRIIEENERIQTEIEALELAQEIMEELSGSIRNSFGFYLNQTASSLINGITGGIYNSLSVDENMNVFLNTKNRLVPLEQVSSGAMDQVYLALRLSTAALMQTGDEDLPFIFDDSFVLYDDERLNTALQWLASSFRRQIILFTCHKREIQILKSQQIPFHLISI